MHRHAPASLAMRPYRMTVHWTSFERRNTLRPMLPTYRYILVQILLSIAEYELSCSRDHQQKFLKQQCSLKGNCQRSLRDLG